MVSNQTHSIPPLRHGGFTFKQFFVAHDRCAMKVSTDGVLLGAWAAVKSAQKILDIGCGSGLIALMLAQRSAKETIIDAVELDSNAASQAEENSKNSPWPQKINVHTQDIQHFAQQYPHQYDLLVSNPPYFEPSVACRDLARSTARYTKALTHDALLDYAEKLITKQGHFCVILPYSIGMLFEKNAQQRGWYSARRLIVSDRADTKKHRLLLALARSTTVTEETELAIKQADGRYTDEFRQLITNFYINY